MMEKRPPVGANDFIEVEKFEQVLNKLTVSQPPSNAVILTGTSGAGKTELALQLVKRMRQRRGEVNNFLSGEFSCDSEPNLISDLKRFVDVNGLQIPSLNTENFETIFREFYKQVNERFPEHMKCFIFDDAERPTDVIRYIDTCICKPLQGNSIQQANWKIIVTTQDARDNWLQSCDVLTTDDFVPVDGFNEKEALNFFKFKGFDALSRDQIRDVITAVDCLPLALRVLKQELKESPLMDYQQFLRKYLKGINEVVGDENRAVAALHCSFERFVRQSYHPDYFRKMILMLTMYDDKNMTTELLVSSAEVILAAGNGIHQPGAAATELANKFVYDMMNRFLCEEPRQFAGTRLVSLHKLVKHSMKLFRNKLSQADQVELVRSSLLALTRVMPRDGRGHQSHVLHGFMLNHGKSLHLEMSKVLGDNLHLLAPTTMLMQCGLLMSMGYCQQARRSPPEHANILFDDAMNVFSNIFKGQRYDTLGTRESQDKDRAEILAGACTNGASPLNNDHFYAGFVADIPRYLRLTAKDLRNMLDYLVENPEDWLINGHLSDSHMAELRQGNKVLDMQCFQLFYPVELLAELYSMRAKARGFHGDNQPSDKCIESADAAMYLYNRVKEDHQVKLLAYIITQRELLKIQLDVDLHPVSLDSLEKIANKWRELEDLAGGAYEYGLMRTDLTKDAYHKFLCAEGHAVCQGRICEAVQGGDRDSRLQETNLLFRTLIEKTKTDRLNLLTTSKTHRHYAEFLWRCGVQRDAIRSVIDSMRYLNVFLCNTDNTSEFPEQQESCGKFKLPLKMLTDYHLNYVSDDQGILLNDGIDHERLNYLKRFWRHQSDNGGSDRFKVFSDILDDSGHGPEHDAVPEPVPDVRITQPMD